MNIRLKCFTIHFNNKKKISALDDLSNSSRKDQYIEQFNL